MIKKEELLKSGERLDSLDRNNLYLIQNPTKFCFGIDAVLLSSFLKADKGDKILDLCTGTGVIPILLSDKTEASVIRGLEIQKDICDMAKRSVLYNNLSEKVDIILGDVKDASKIFGASSFDIVCVNPPYMKNNHGIKNPDNSKYISRHEVLCTLDDVIRETGKILNTKGKFFMVHRPTRLVDIFTTMRHYDIEPKRMRLVFPYKDKEPNLVLVEGVKGGGGEIRIEKPLIVYKDKNLYTDEVLYEYGK